MNFPIRNITALSTLGITGLVYQIGIYPIPGVPVFFPVHMPTFIPSSGNMTTQALFNSFISTQIPSNSVMCTSASFKVRMNTKTNVENDI